jgi:hypothetical protein
MNEIYWITRFDGIHTFATIIMVIGIILSVIVGIIYYIANGQYIFEHSRGKEQFASECKGYRDTCKKMLSYLVPITIFFTSVNIFVPTTKEALSIYGIGGTIDYLKENPTAKQIPNKCIMALDKWVDSWTIDNDSTKRNKN